MRQINIDFQNYAGLGWMTVDCVATSNINTTVGQTIAGVLVTTSTRVLKVGQTAPAENGIYINDARAPEMDTDVILKNTVVNGSNKLYLCQSGVVGTNLNWSPFNIENLGNTSITNPTNGNLLYYDGTNWINGTIQSAVGTSWCAPTAELYFQGSYALTLTFLNTWYKIAPAATFLSNNTSFTTTAWSNPSNNALRWLFPFNSRLFHVAVSITLMNTGSNQTLELSIYVNGVIVNGSVVTQRLQSSTDRQMFSFHKALILNTNDTVEIYVRNISTGGTSTTFLNTNCQLVSCCSYSAST